MAPFRLFAQANGFTGAQSWSDGLAKVRAAIADPGVLVSEDDLRSFVEDLVTNGAKSIFFIPNDPKLRDQTRQVVPHSSPFDGGFPAQIDLNIDPLPPAYRTPMPVKVIDHPDAREIVFCSIRSSERREPLDRTYLTPNTPARIRNADIFYRDVVRYQAYDTIFAPNEGTQPIRMAVDTAGSSHPDDIERARLGLFDAWASALGRTPYHGRPLNLFPAILSLYEDANDGRVTNLHFDCTTQVSRREKVRRSSREDLRSEAYHLAGSQQVTIAPYRIGVTWKFDSGLPPYESEAHLPSSLGELHSTRFLDRADFPRFQTREALEFMIQRILHHAGHVR